VHSAVNAKMSTLKKYYSLNNFVNSAFCFLPISFAIGSLIVNINIILLIFLGSRLAIVNKLRLNLNKIDYFLILFFFFYIFSTILNIQLLGIEYVFKSLFSLRFLVLYFLVKIFLENDKIELNLFFKICLICTSFLSVDIFMQFFYGKDLFGIPPHDGRVAGFFGSEGIAGGYIQKFFLFSFLGLFSFAEKKNYKNLLILVFLFVHLNAIAITNNRMSLILLVFTLIILTIFIPSLRKILILNFMIITCSFYFLFITNDNISKHFKRIQTDIVQLEQKEGSKKEFGSTEYKINFFKSDHGKLYMSVIQSYKSNIFFGNGYKSFRLNCSKVCSTQPHNYQLEVLHDTGLIGFIFLSIFIIFKLIIKIVKIVKRKDLNLVYYFTFLNFFIEIFPLKSTGSLFSTWSGTLAWLIIALSVYEIKKYEN